MAHAWKACWVHPLTSSNLVSSASQHRAATAIGGRAIDTGTVPAESAATTVAVRGSRPATALLATAVAALFVSALLGPSSAEPALPGAAALPPYSVDTHPSETFVSALLALALVLGALGVHTAWRALERGWSPAPRRLLAASLLATSALCLVPTIGSSDIVSYAAYGRMATTGHDPYATTPEVLAGTGDPIAVNVQGWLHASSIYGPLATGEQALASAIGGRSLRTTVVLLTVVNALGFAATTMLLFAGARDDARRRRALLLWGLNPLLLFELVSAGHVDALASAFLVGGVLALRRSPLLAAVLFGAALDVKLSLAIVGVGLAVALWRRWRSLAALAAGCLAAVVPPYLAAGPHVLDQARTASTFVVHASLWQPVALLIDGTGWRRVVTTLAWLAAAALAVVLLRRQRAFATGEPDIARRAASGIAAVLTAYVLLSAYVLPWYDAPLWAMLALLPPTALDRVVLVHTGVLSVAYLPGNSVALTSGVVKGAQFVVQRLVAPPVLALLAFRTARAETAEQHRP